MQLLQLLSEQLHVPYIDIRNYSLDPNVVKLLPEFYARHFRAIVLKNDTDEALVGMVDPQNLLALDELERILKKKVKIALIREEDLLYALDTLYRRAEEISHFAETLSAELKPNEINIFSETQDLTSDDMPVVNLLRAVLKR